MSYERPTYDAADASWVGAQAYTRPAYDAADASFVQDEVGAVVLVSAWLPAAIEAGIGVAVVVSGGAPAEIDQPPGVVVTVAAELPETLITIGWRVVVSPHTPAEIIIAPTLVVEGTAYPSAEIDYPSSAAVSVVGELPELFVTIGWRVAATAHKPAEILLSLPGTVSAAAQAPLVALASHPAAHSVLVTGYAHVVLTTLSPVRLLPSYEFDGVRISFDIDDLAMARIGVAHPTDEDWRRVTQGLMARVEEYLATLRPSQVRHLLYLGTNDYTYEHADLGNVWRQTSSLLVDRAFLNAHIIGQP